MRNRRTLERAVLGLLFATLATTGMADDKKSAPPADLPGAEHAKLAPLAGNWTYTCRCWMEPGTAPIEMTGTAERKWILGGRFLEERVKGTGFDGQPGFEGVGLLGYDNHQQKYTQTFVCNMGTGTSTGLGLASGADKLTFQTTCYCPLSQETISGRDEIKIETRDRIVMESYKTVAGKELKVMEIVYVRGK